MQKKTIGKLPLDLPTPSVRHRNPAYRDRTGGGIKEIDKAASLLRRIIVCAIIIAVILIIKNINTEFTQNVVGYIRDGINKHINLDDALGKLKFVGDYLPDSIVAFGQRFGDGKTGSPQEVNPVFSIPAEGKVVKKFGQGHNGINILGTENHGVYAVADGIVLETGQENEGDIYIKINHGDNVTTLYKGCSQITVKVGDKLNKGDRIAVMGESSDHKYTLYFETRINNKPVDPIKFIETAK